MARTRKRMTQEQFAASLLMVEANLGNIKPIMTKFARRYQASMRRNLRQGKNANGTPMAPLSPLTKGGRITTKDGSPGPHRGGGGPLNATGEMVKAFKAVADAKGWIAYVNDDYKRKVSFWQGNVPSGQPLRIRPRRDKTGRSMARAMAKKGMPVSPKTAAKGFVRPARLPFGLNSRQVKRSVTDLNKHVLKPFLQ